MSTACFTENAVYVPFVQILQSYSSDMWGVWITQCPKWLADQGLISTRGRHLFLRHHTSRPVFGHSQPPSNWYRGCKSAGAWSWSFTSIRCRWLERSMLRHEVTFYPSPLHREHPCASLWYFLSFNKLHRTCIGHIFLLNVCVNVCACVFAQVLRCSCAITAPFIAVSESRPPRFSCRLPWGSLLLVIQNAR